MVARVLGVVARVLLCGLLGYLWWLLWYLGVARVFARLLLVFTDSYY